MIDVLLSIKHSSVTYDPMSHLSTHSGFLQQVLLDLGSFDGPSLVEVDIDVLSEATGVIITDGLGVAKG